MHKTLLFVQTEVRHISCLSYQTYPPLCFCKCPVRSTRYRVYVYLCVCYEPTKIIQVSNKFAVFIKGKIIHGLGQFSESQEAEHSSQRILGKNELIFLCFNFSVTVDVQHHISVRCTTLQLDIYRTYRVTILCKDENVRTGSSKTVPGMSSTA